VLKYTSQGTAYRGQASGIQLIDETLFLCHNKINTEPIILFPIFYTHDWGIPFLVIG